MTDIFPYLHNDLVKKLNKTTFTLLVDTTTDITQKCIPLLHVKFFNDKTEEITRRLYATIELSDSKHESITKAILNKFKEDRIDLTNFKAFMSGGAQNFSSEENGVYGSLSVECAFL